MQTRHVYVAVGVALVAAAGLIADRSTQLRKYVLPNRISTDGRKMLPNGWRVTPAGRHIQLPGDLPMKMIVTQDDKLLVNTAGWHDHDVNVIDIKSEKLEQSLEVGKNWDGMSLDPKSGMVYVSSGGTPKAGYYEEATSGLTSARAFASRNHKLSQDLMAMVGKPVLRLRYAGGRLSLQSPLSIKASRKIVISSRE